MARDEFERTIIVRFGEADYRRLIAIAQREKIKVSVFVENATLNEINNKREKKNGTVQI